MDKLIELELENAADVPVMRSIEDVAIHCEDQVTLLSPRDIARDLRPDIAGIGRAMDVWLSTPFISRVVEWIS